MGCCGWRNVRRDDVLMIRVAEVSSVWRLFIGCLVRLGEFWSVMSDVSHSLIGWVVHSWIFGRRKIVRMNISSRQET